jgi:hypothetical protein
MAGSRGTWRDIGLRPDEGESASFENADVQFYKSLTSLVAAI